MNHVSIKVAVSPLFCCQDVAHSSPSPKPLLHSHAGLSVSVPVDSMFFGDGAVEKGPSRIKEEKATKETPPSDRLEFHQTLITSVVRHSRMWCLHDIGRDSWVWGEQEALYNIISPHEVGEEAVTDVSRCREENGVARG